MTHLFFDASTFPWHLQEANDLQDLLSRLIADAATIDQIRKRCGPNVRPLVQPAAADAMWTQLLEHVTTAGRLRDLDRILRDESRHIAIALDKLIAAASPDPASWFFDAPVFVNRTSLRTALAQLGSAQTDKTVLVVRGERHSGKTWTKHIVRHYAQLTGFGCTYLCEGMVTTVEQAVDGIMAELEADTPPVLTTEAASYTTVAQAMLRAAQKRQRGSWIIMDDLGPGPDGAPLIDGEIRRLFEQLALNTLNPAFAKWFKLVLIAYPDESLPSKWRGCALEERTAVADMHAVAVGEFLLSWARRHGKTLSDLDARALAEEIIRKASVAVPDADTRSLLERVHDELTLVQGEL